MSVDSVRNRFLNLLKVATRAGAHSLFPDDIEYYGLALELVDSQGVTVDMLTFPVMPSNIQDNITFPTNIKKTAGGVVVLDTNTFIPFPINISGDFGRKFRFLIGRENIVYTGMSIKGIVQTGRSAVSYLSASVKTGYGVAKVLERMILLSKQLDQYNKPHRLYYYNQSKNSNYMVEVKSFSLPQSKEKNAMWSYSISFMAVAPAAEARGMDDSSLAKLCAADVISQTANLLSTTAQQLLLPDTNA